MIGKDLWEIVEVGYKELADWNALTPNDKKTKKEEKKKNAQELFHIQITLDKSSFPRIVDAKSAKNFWKTLKESYQGND